MEPIDEVTSTDLQDEKESSRGDINGQVAKDEREMGHSDALSPKFDEDTASGASGAVLPPPPTEVNLLNQLDDKLEAAAQQNFAAAQIRASENQLPTPMDSQLVDQPQLQEPDESQNSDEVMAMEVEEVVTTQVVQVEQTEEPIEARDLATTTKTDRTTQASTSIEMLEPVFETQVPYQEPIRAAAYDELSQSQGEIDTQMEDNISDFVSQETVDDDTLQAALRGEQGDEEEEEEEEEDALQAALLEEEQEDEEDSVEDALQAALREEDDEREEEEAGEAEVEDGEDGEDGKMKSVKSVKRDPRRKMLCKPPYEKNKTGRMRK
ncbi:hypothetical protein PG997_013229 [Apiospora hydei]|uniref:Uncharacterized protein n=1 Tax=Apiospora hydei TaxID=1337664 RepID=A0ABR1V5J9_9PEZI